MYLNSCLDVSDLTQKEFLKPGETELALISKSMVFKFSFFLCTLIRFLEIRAGKSS